MAESVSTQGALWADRARRCAAAGTRRRACRVDGRASAGEASPSHGLHKSLFKLAAHTRIRSHRGRPGTPRLAHIRIGHPQAKQPTLQSSLSEEFEEKQNQWSLDHAHTETEIDIRSARVVNERIYSPGLLVSSVDELEVSDVCEDTVRPPSMCWDRAASGPVRPTRARRVRPVSGGKRPRMISTACSGYWTECSYRDGVGERRRLRNARVLTAPGQSYSVSESRRREGRSRRSGAGGARWKIDNTSQRSLQELLRRACN